MKILKDIEELENQWKKMAEQIDQIRRELSHKIETEHRIYSISLSSFGEVVITEESKPSSGLRIHEAVVLPPEVVERMLQIIDRWRRGIHGDDNKLHKGDT